MYANCFRRLVGSSASRTTLSNAQLFLTTSNVSSGRQRCAPDLWRSVLLHDHHATDPHPTAPQREAHSTTAPPNMNWCQMSTDVREGAVPEQSPDSFRASAPVASLGVAEMAAALTLVGLGTLHLPVIADPPSTIFPAALHSALWTESLKVSDAVLPNALSAQSPAPAVTISLDDAGKLPQPPSQATSIAAPEAYAPAAVAVDAAASPAADITAAEPPTQPQQGSSSAAAVPLSATTQPADSETDYLPIALRSLVPSSVAAYWRDVQKAHREGRLHATIYVSRRAWPQAAPIIAAMMGMDGRGPAGQVRFALVPLGEGYAARADAAQRTRLGPGGQVGDWVAAEFGLDVALAACALGEGERVRRGVRRLEACPALVVRGAYTGSAGVGEVSPAWSMRQELDEHVRRNLVYGRQQQEQQQQLLTMVVLQEQQ